MELWQAVLLSIVEGATEFLPISSTGHMILAGKLINLTQTDFVKSFEIAIQLGAILAVGLMYWRRMLVNKQEMLRIGAAFVPTAILGFGLYRIVKTVFLGNVWITVAALGAGGVAMIFFDRLFAVKENNIMKIENLSYSRAVMIGILQAVAVVPGVSRALMTIAGGMYAGLSRKEAVELSFMLAIPTMAAATGYDLLKSGYGFTGQEWTMLGAGFAGAFVSAYIVAKWLLVYVQKHNFKVFGYYRIILAALFLLAV